MAPPDAPQLSAGTRRWRLGWVFAAIWLVYLGAPLRALADHRGGWERDLGLFGLAGFVAVYLVSVADGRRSREAGEQRTLTGRWLQIAALVALGGLMIPAAGQHALTASVYVAAAAMMILPPRQGLAAAAALFAVAETLPRVVPGWRDAGYGLAVLLATAAVWGIRLAFERNQRLVQAQAELGRMAVDNERARIAADLHDILGHSLTVVAVKAELAQRLLDVDPQRARAELRAWRCSAATRSPTSARPLSGSAGSRSPGSLRRHGRPSRPRTSRRACPARPTTCQAGGVSCSRGPSERR